MSAFKIKGKLLVKGGLVISPGAALEPPTPLGSDRLIIMNDSDPLIPVYTVDSATDVYTLERDIAITLSEQRPVVTVSPDGTMVAFGAYDAPYVTIYETAGWEWIKSVMGFIDEITSIKWSPDGTKIAVVQAYSTLKLRIINTSDWSVITPASIPFSRDSRDCIAWSPDSSMLACVDGQSGRPAITVYDASDWTIVSNGIVFPSSGYGCAITFVNDGAQLVAGMANNMDIHVYNTSDWSQVSAPGLINIVGNAYYAGAESIAYFKDATRNYLVMGGQSGVAVLVDVNVGWEVAEYLQVTTLEAGVPVQSLSFTADGSRLLCTAPYDNFGSIFDTSDWTITNVIEGDFPEISYCYGGTFVQAATATPPPLPVNESPYTYLSDSYWTSLLTTGGPTPPAGTPYALWNGTSWSMNPLTVDSGVMVLNLKPGWYGTWPVQNHYVSRITVTTDDDGMDHEGGYDMYIEQANTTTIKFVTHWDSTEEVFVFDLTEEEAALVGRINFGASEAYIAGKNPKITNIQFTLSPKA
jgi:hypothetical protein